MELSSSDKKFLLKTARETINEYLKTNKIPEIDFSNRADLNKKCGAFVTLKKNGKLRGCIGFVLSEDPLTINVQRAAVYAATEDPRFPKVSPIELNQIELEISVLSTPFKMNSYDEIEIGKHGLILEDMGGRGLLLPQVPIEHNLNKEEFLTALCEKAGINSRAWKEKLLNIKMFTALVFNESVLNDEV